MVTNHCKPEELGSQHLLEDGKDSCCICFCCERGKLECKGAKNCKFGKKADRSLVNSLEVVATKFADIKEEMRRRYAAGQLRESFDLT